MTDLERAADVFDPYDFDLHESAEGGHSCIDYEVYFKEDGKYITYTAEIIAHHGCQTWIFEAVNITDLEFNGVEPSFTVDELEILIEKTKFRL